MFSVVLLLYLSFCISIALLLRPTLLPLGNTDQSVLTLEILVSCRISFLQGNVNIASLGRKIVGESRLRLSLNIGWVGVCLLLVF